MSTKFGLNRAGSRKKNFKKGISADDSHKIVGPSIRQQPHRFIEENALPSRMEASPEPAETVRGAGALAPNAA